MFVQKIEDRLRLGNKNKQAYFVLLSAYTIFAKIIEDRLRLGNKNKQAYFVLLSACTIFVVKPF